MRSLTFCTKFTALQLQFEALFDIMLIFARVEPWSDFIQEIVHILNDK